MQTVEVINPNKEDQTLNESNQFVYRINRISTDEVVEVKIEKRLKNK